MCCGWARIRLNSYNRFAALFQQTSSGRLVRPSKENWSPAFTTFKWINLLSDLESNEISLLGGGGLFSNGKKFLRSISARRLDSLICSCVFYTMEASVPIPTRSRLLYEITWILYQLCHLGPITWATDEQHTHTHTHSYSQWGKRSTLYTAVVFILYTGRAECAQILNMIILQQRTPNGELLWLLLLISTMHSCVIGSWLLGAVQRSSVLKAKVSSVHCPWITGSMVMYDTLLFLATIRRLWQFNICEIWTQPLQKSIFGQFVLQYLQ